MDRELRRSKLAFLVSNDAQQSCLVCGLGSLHFLDGARLLGTKALALCSCFRKFVFEFLLSLKHRLCVLQRVRPAYTIV